MSTFFILASERSGTNLLRTLFSGHSKVAAPPPAPVMEPFQECSYLYERQSSHPSALIEDLTTLLGLEDSAYQWEWVPDEKEVLERSKGRNVIQIIEAFYQAYAAHFEKEHAFCKESRLFKLPCLIDRQLPDAKFIYLIRDGRDVALSERNAPSKRRPTMLLAERWRAEQIHCWNAYYALLPQDKIFFLRYEELLKDPEGVMKSLFHWAGLEMEDGIFDQHRSANTRQHAARTRLWENIDRPLMKGNVEKYKSGFSRRQIKIFERVAGDLLLQSGYLPWDSDHLARRIPRGVDLYYRGVNKLNKWLLKGGEKQQERSIRTFLSKRMKILSGRKRELLEESR